MIRKSEVEFSAAVRNAAAEWIARRDAGLSAAEEAQFERWLASDPRHGAAFDWYGGPWAALDRPARTGLAQNVLERVQALDRRRCCRRIATVAATVAILGVAVVLWRQSMRPIRDTVDLAGTAKWVVPAHRILSDGTTVDLKEGAEIAVHYTPTSRRVTLRRGEAHFHVAKVPAIPFIVAASGIEFRAVGTAFSVQLGVKQVELLVSEGRVAVDNAVGPAPGVGSKSTSSEVHARDKPSRTIATVDAGNRLVVPALLANGKHPEQVAIAATDMSERLAWRVPRLEFTGTPLGEAVEILNRQLPRPDQVRLVIEDPSITQVRISGLFRADNMAAFVDLLESGFGITAERRGEAEIVLRRHSAGLTP